MRPPARPARGDRDGQVRGHELNYVSDVDVIFASSRPTAPTRRGRPRGGTAGRPPDPDLLRAHGRGHDLAGGRGAASRGQGRPAGADPGQPPGVLRTLGKTWEFQALLKARPVAGDLALGREYVEMLAPLVWTAAERDGFVDGRPGDAPPRRRAHPRPGGRPPAQARPGGLRDVEFAVQLLQLVHGRADERIRAPPTTLSALARLTRGGYVGREDGESLTARTRSCAPSSTASSSTAAAHPRRTRRRGGAAPARAQHGVQGPDRDVRQGLAAPPPRGAAAAREAVLPAAARGRREIPGSEARLSPGGRREAAVGTGLRRPEGGAAPPRGADQRGDPHRPDPAHPAAGHARLVRRRPRPRRRPVRLPADQRVARRTRRGTSRRCATRAGRRALARLLATSRYATDVARARAAGRADAGGGPPAAAEALTEEMLASAAPPGRPGEGGPAIRAIRRRELFRIAVGDLLGLTDVADVGAGLSRLTDATLEATLDVAVARCEQRGGSTRPRPGWRWSPWAGTAASSCPTAATPTCCSCTTPSRAPTRRPRRRTPTRWPTSSAACSRCPGPTPR